MGYIYIITNLINYKVYIGKTQYKNPEKRWNEHKRYSRSTRVTYRNKPLYRAMRKYGIDNFSFEILEETDECSERERYYIRKFNAFSSNGYNATTGGEGSSLITESECRDIVNLYLSQKITIREVAKITAHDERTIGIILSDYGVPKRERDDYRKKPVIQRDMQTGKEINKYDSARDAAKALGPKAFGGHITMVCIGKRRSAYGYTWEYAQ